MDVTLRHADVGVSGDSSERPHIATALSQAGEERVPDGIHLEVTQLRRSECFLVLQLEAVVIDMPRLWFWLGELKKRIHITLAPEVLDQLDHACMGERNELLPSS